jgi:uncharacterized membrane protein YccC
MRCRLYAIGIVVRPAAAGGYDGSDMRRYLQRLGEQFARGPNRIALSTALRGTIATILPLVLLPRLGFAELAYPAVLGALATSMVDVGGPYRTRLVAMLVQALGGPCLLLLGSAAVEHWWLAALVMAAIGILSGFIRALGPGGASLGINTAVAFLVGLQVGEIGRQEAAWALGYGTGGLWTVVVVLAFWQLRPYRRLEQEVAGAWEAVAALVEAVAGAEDESVVARRRREQRIAASHTAARAAVELAREALGEMRAGTVGPGSTIAQLLVLLNAAARIGAAVVTLGEVGAPPGTARFAAEAELERACRAVARALLDGKGELPLAELRLRLDAERAGRSEPQGQADLLAWAQAMRHLDNAEEALHLLFGARRRLPRRLRLPLAHRRPRGAVSGALRAHATPRSAIFRHAVRVAVVTAVDTAIVAYCHLPHGIWLPLTSLVILQPEYGGTVARALERGLGTVAGAVLAGALLTTVHGTAGYDAAIALFLFATFLLIRRRYGYAIVCLTPIIILLIGMSSADPWVDLAERVAYTAVGALLALAAGFLLWPQWEREQLRDRLARAIRADKAYLDAVLEALAEPAAQATSLPGLRREAEMSVANADAGFQRMLAEPARRTVLLGAGFALLVYLHRLCRHAIALSAQRGVAAAPPEPLSRLRRLMAAALDDAAQAMGEGRPPAPRPGFDASLAELAAALSPGSASDPGDAIAALLSRLVSDTTGILNATGSAGEDARARSRGG